MQDQGRDACLTKLSRKPECPRARLAVFIANINRTTPGCSGAPTSTQCERIKLHCKVAKSARLMRVLASLPKPVLLP